MFSSFLQQVYTYSHWDVVKEQERLDSMKEGAFFDVGSNGIIKAFYYIRKCTPIDRRFLIRY